MRIQDKVYGEMEVTEPLLIELIHSKPVQRMKGIMQGGACFYVDPAHDGSRYEHCVGVMLLLQKFGASLEEQAAGLLHDVGHTAFSHVIDVVFREYNHNYDDAHLEQVIRESEIPKTLSQHNINWKRMAEKHHYSLLEQPSPALCGDRIDYTLRDSIRRTDGKQIKYWIDNLVTHNNAFAFRDVKSAHSFALHYIHMDQTYWTEPQKEASFQILAAAIREALEKKILSEKDLYLTDMQVMQKLKQAPNEKIQQCLKMLTPNLRVAVNPTTYDYMAYPKRRWVDPPVLTNGTTSPLSQLEPAIIPLLNQQKNKNNQATPIQILSY